MRIIFFLLDSESQIRRIDLKSICQRRNISNKLERIESKLFCSVLRNKAKNIYDISIRIFSSSLIIRD